jgi:two-component system CheB/CheR fusion protein
MEVTGAPILGGVVVPNPPTEDLLVVLRGLSAAHDLDGVQTVIRASVRRVIGADGVTLVLRDQDRCYYADEDAIAPLWKGQRFPMSACISGWVMLNRTCATIEDIYSDSRIPIDAYRPTFVKSLAMVPVRREGPIGALGAYWATPHRPTEAEVRTLEAIADAVGIALMNVELIGAMQAALEEARNANRAKDEFLAVVSHELRTPLTAVLGWTAMLRKGTLPPATVSRALEVVDRNARAQLDLVEDLLATSQAARGRLQLVPRPTNVRALIHDAVEAIRVDAVAKGLTLASALDDAGAIHVDPDRLRQIVWNLLKNAVEFTPEGGSVHAALRATPGAIEIEVRDSGEGIPPEVLPYVFDRFRQADSSATRRHGGLGLGLTLVRTLVELHDGTVTAHSDGAGRGARFVVRLPAAG